VLSKNAKKSFYFVWLTRNKKKFNFCDTGHFSFAGQLQFRPLKGRAPLVATSRPTIRFSQLFLRSKATTNVKSLLSNLWRRFSQLFLRSKATTNVKSLLSNPFTKFSQPLLSVIRDKVRLQNEPSVFESSFHFKRNLISCEQIFFLA
jgi:hypothetical protein